jgi:branched-chain amino acid transport system substrate-binding protein
MNGTLLRRLSPLLLGSSMALGLSAANSEELRIGYVAPTTGIFAQVGKDMVDGFKMYLDEHKNKFGSADV